MPSEPQMKLPISRWLWEHSSGVYRPSRTAAERIEEMYGELLATYQFLKSVIGSLQGATLPHHTHMDRPIARINSLEPDFKIEHQLLSQSATMRTTIPNVPVTNPELCVWLRQNGGRGYHQVSQGADLIEQIEIELVGARSTMLMIKDAIKDVRGDEVHLLTNGAANQIKKFIDKISAPTPAATSQMEL